jgi:glycosyltransferase involved in cell wall biosynthesis
MNAYKAPARVKVFVPSFRRPKLLRRALDSLIRQTFADWRCEVHNDDPHDLAPVTVISEFDDTRIELINHEKNLGPTRTFNLFFSTVSEPYISLLEDDNWWEPTFLESLLAAIERFPDVSLIWCNQRIWEEMPDGSWRDTGKFVNPPARDPAPTPRSFGDHRQALGALHSNGAMLLRSENAASYKTPDSLPFNGMEAFRERLINFPMLYLPEAHAVFSKTIGTSRSKGHAEWTELQVMFAATFLKNARYGDGNLYELLEKVRSGTPPATTPLILAALVEPKSRRLLKFTRADDWLRFIKATARRPAILWSAFTSKARHPEWWKALDTCTADRFREQREHPYRASLMRPPAFGSE